MKGFFNRFYNLYILMTPVDIPYFVYILVHLLVILPLNYLAFFLVFKTKDKPLKKRERYLKAGALAMGFVMLIRYSLYTVYVFEAHYFNSIFKFEMSEIAMYLLILSIFVIKKKWFYPLAFTVGLISCIAVIVYPYTVFSHKPPFHLYTVSSILFHALNGYMACMLLTARSYVPRLKQIGGVLLGNVVLFIIILVANRVTGENFMALSDPSKLPIIGNLKPPISTLIIFMVFNSMSFAVLAVSEIIFIIHGKRQRFKEFLKS